MAAVSKTQKRISKAHRNPVKGSSILKAAEAIFARKGFHTATISEIAKKAKVSEATIYEYFSSKEELLFNIPAETIRRYHEKNHEILPYIQGAANKLRFLIFRHLKLYADNPNYANVVMLIIKVNRNFLNTDAYKIVKSSAQKYIKILEEGIRSGEFRADTNPYLLRAMIWGTIEHTVTRKSLLGKPEDLESMADELYQAIVKGIQAPVEAAALHVKLTVERGAEAAP
jgi:AcrR family transcriptional regulator